MHKQTAAPTTTAIHKASVTAPAQGRQQHGFYDVLTQLTLQQMRHRASQRT